jgi:predicted small integral membrane protein
VTINSRCTNFLRSTGRAINSPVIHSLFYWMIIVWELLSSAVCWCGGVRLARSIAEPAGEFHREKGLAVAGLTFSLLLWLVAFLAVGEGWFLMWQSRTANGQKAAFRMFAIVGIALLLLAQPDVD